MKYTRIPLIATLSLLAACGSDSTAPADINNGTVSGSVSFTYTGGGGGSYSATGAIGSSVVTTNTGTWAVGWKENTYTNVASNVAKTGGLADQAVVLVKGQTTGAFTINSTCDPTTTVSCTGVILILGINATSSSWSYLCALESGTVNITSISSTNATGTFSGTGTCVSAPGASSVFTVTNGTFNVPLVTRPT